MDAANRQTQARLTCEVNKIGEHDHKAHHMFNDPQVAYLNRAEFGATRGV